MIRKMNRKSRILLCIGLIITSSITLVRDYIVLPDYLRGILASVGLGLMIWALKRTAPSCFRRSKSLSDRVR
jgi:hypothetical protein